MAARAVYSIIDKQYMKMKIHGLEYQWSSSLPSLELGTLSSFLALELVISSFLALELVTAAILNLKLIWTNFDSCLLLIIFTFPWVGLGRIRLLGRETMKLPSGNLDSSRNWLWHWAWSTMVVLGCSSLGSHHQQDLTSPGRLTGEGAQHCCLSSMEGNGPLRAKEMKIQQRMI